MQGFLDLAVFRCLAHAGKPVTAGTEGIARHNGDMFFTQQFLGEVFIVHARGLDVGKGIESTARLKGRQTEAEGRRSNLDVGRIQNDIILLTMDEGALLNNRYQLLERIGTGGMADVFRARDLMLVRSVAIKILHEAYSDDQAFQDRFKQEARAAANLSHPNIVTVHDFGFDHGQLFIVMEHIPGKDLKTILRQRGRYSVEEAIPLIVQACAGIGYAHRAGLVHCDIKPHNMIVTPDGRLKVTDFGIARALSTIMPDERADVVWGSPQYFSPEQAVGEAPSPASDVYSLGIVL